MTSGGFGLQVRIAISAVQTVIVNMTEGEIPEFEKFLAESTPHNASQGYKTWQDTGKRSLNSFKVTLTWDDSQATHQAIMTAFNSTSPVAMSVIAPDASETISFNAHISKLGRVSEQEDIYKCEVEIQPTGAPTIT